MHLQSSLATTIGARVGNVERLHGLTRRHHTLDADAYNSCHPTQLGAVSKLSGIILHHKQEKVERRPFDRKPDGRRAQHSNLGGNLVAVPRTTEIAVQILSA